MNGALLRLHILMTNRFAPHDRERGASLVEYALLIGLIAIVCFAAVGFLGQRTASQFDSTGSSFATN